MVLIELFLSFLKIGFTSFGGLSMIPLINAEMIAHGWMSAEEVADIVAIAEMTPGPMGVNCATFAGIRVFGLAGAFSAVLGVLIPSLTLCLVGAVFLEKLKGNRCLNSILYAIRPLCIGMIAAALVTIGQSAYFPAGAISIPAILIGCAIAFLLVKYKLSVPIVVTIAAVLGLFLVR